MTDLFYNQGTPEIKLIEECAELIKAVCKYERFKVEATDPKTGIVYRNDEDIKREMDDVIQAMEKMEIKIRADVYEFYKDKNPK